VGHFVKQDFGNLKLFSHFKVIVMLVIMTVVTTRNVTVWKANYSSVCVLETSVISSCVIFLLISRGSVASGYRYANRIETYLRSIASYS